MNQSKHLGQVLRTVGFISVSVSLALIPSQLMQVFYLWATYIESLNLRQFPVSPPPSFSCHQDLLIFPPPHSPSPRPPDHIHLPVSTIRERKEVESAEGGRGCPANQQKEKGEDLKSAKERRRGWTWISLTPRTTPNWPKILFSPPSPGARVRVEIRCGAQFEHFILHNLPSRRCWYQGNLAQRHLKCASSDIHEAYSLRFLWQ